MEVGIKIALDADGRVIQDFGTHVPNYSMSQSKRLSRSCLLDSASLVNGYMIASSSGLTRQCRS
jgi:hypothetical protein